MTTRLRPPKSAAKTVEQPSANAILGRRSRALAPPRKLPLTQPSHAQRSLVFHDARFDPSPFINVPAIVPEPVYRTDLGALFHADCLELLAAIRDRCIDTVFADPPFNLKKQYGPNGKDDLDEAAYVSWCHRWIRECVRVLKPGGAFFLYNLPKWNLLFGASLIEMKMTFRHWIAIDMKNCLPIPGRLYPSHYSMLYYYILRKGLRERSDEYARQSNGVAIVAERSEIMAVIATL